MLEKLVCWKVPEIEFSNPSISTILNFVILTIFKAYTIFSEGKSQPMREENTNSDAKHPKSLIFCLLYIIAK